MDKTALTEKLIAYAPDVDIHIIPDQMYAHPVKIERRKKLVFNLLDLLKSVVALLLATSLGIIFQKLKFTEANIIMIYILSVLVISVITNHQIYGLLSSIASVFIFNFFFTQPKYTLLAHDPGYPVTFLIMFLAALITGSLAARLKEHARRSAQIAYRMKILFDTDQLLAKVKGNEKIIQVTAGQLVKLLKRDVVMYPIRNGQLEKPELFLAETEGGHENILEEGEAARWVMENNRRAGAATEHFPEAKCQYLPIRMNHNVYGVAGIHFQGQKIGSFEEGILLSILGECALALENDKNAREKEEAAVLAKNEQLRANLLRTISHDLRTPLTSISGNASNLMSNERFFDEATKQQLYADIYEDSLWLINLVENLLAVTRIQDGEVRLHMAAELLDDIIQEALCHVNCRSVEHFITVELPEEILLVKVDARLMVQVLINLIDNAVKYSPAGSHIVIGGKKENRWILVTVEDDGPGIGKEELPHIFDMFYSGANKVADARRSLGLGLFLCRTIINAHGGEITVSNVEPHGSRFTFTLPAEEVTVDE